MWGLHARGHGNTRVEFESLHSPGSYAIFPAGNPKIRIFTVQKNIRLEKWIKLAEWHEKLTKKNQEEKLEEWRKTCENKK